jgi:predicted ATPase
MQNQDTVQLSLFDFNFDEADQSGGIENLFTEKDMSRFGKGRKGWSENGIKEATLIEAVIEWIRYLEVGYDIQTIDEGSIGRRLKIQLEENGRFIDLTNVGVGVSQVLPILVTSLLAEKFSTLIFEQPELHLHPKIQTRLGDFFLSIIQLEKQCIIETHSEHIVNRLRYKAITSPKDKVPEKALIYFVEKNQGRSNYRLIRINEYGNIGKWPKGFFDESESNALSIINAIQAKRRGK